VLTLPHKQLQQSNTGSNAWEEQKGRDSKVRAVYVHKITEERAGTRRQKKRKVSYPQICPEFEVFIKKRDNILI